MKRQTLWHLCLLVSLNLIVWLNTLSFNFFNDDFQILEYVSDSQLEVFTQKDVSNVYYRPIPNFFLASILNIFGFNPLAFHIYLFVLYICVVFSAYFFFEQLFNNSIVSLFGAGIFSILPSHDMYLVWLASNGDLWATLACLVFAIGLFSQSKSGTYIAIISIFIGFLSKESTIVAPIFPLLLIPFFNKDRKKYLIISSVSFALLAIVFLYRFLFLGINVLESTNLSHISIGGIIANYIAYIPAIFVPSFVPPIQLPYVPFVIGLIVAVVAILFFFRRSISLKNIEPNYIVGLLWYFVFVLPVSTLFMRWYSFLPSVGIMIIFLELLRKRFGNNSYIVRRKDASVILSRSDKVMGSPPPPFHKTEKGSLFKIGIAVLLIFSTIDIYSIAGWKQGNARAKEILESISSIQTERSSIMLWFFPQYYNNFIILRSGIHQAINHHSKIPFDEIMMPISIVLNKGTEIKYRQIDSNMFEFTTKNVDLFIGERKEPIKDSANVSSESYRLQVHKIARREFSVKVQFVSMNESFANYYFNGKEFKPFGR
jgi:hypothetical protein